MSKILLFDNSIEISLKVKYTTSNKSKLCEVYFETGYGKKIIDNGDDTYTVELYSEKDLLRFIGNEFLLSVEYLDVTNKTTYVCFKDSLITTIDTKNWDTSGIKSLYMMFQRCKELTSLDVSNFDTSNVTNMKWMFDGCNKLNSLKGLSNWDTSNVTDMNAMFYSCKELTSLDLSNWDTSNVTNMRFMFYNCNNLTSLNLSNWDTSNADISAFFVSHLSGSTNPDERPMKLKSLYMRGWSFDCLYNILDNSFDPYKIPNEGTLYTSKLTNSEIENLKGLTSSILTVGKWTISNRNY